MKKLITTLTLVATLCSANLSYAADRYVMLKIGGGTASASQSVAANEIATLLWSTYLSGTGNKATLNVTYGGTAHHLYFVDITGSVNHVGPDLRRFVIAGPATITYSTGDNTSHLLSLKISPNPNIMGIKQ